MTEPRPDALPPGLIIDGRYRVERAIGAGGMGEVYAVRRLNLDDHAALKRLLPEQDTPPNRQRFATEARAAAHIRHPNVVQVFDYGDDRVVGPYLVMEKLDGPTLAAELRAGPIEVERAVWLFAAVCAAVEAGHRRGIVHRDLKPANVIIASTDDGRELVKVLDFGLAVDQRLPARDITAPGAVIGTVSYMAPEQTEGHPASPRSDVFALGVMLYELVTGRLPFEGATSLQTLLAIGDGRYRPAGELVADLPPGVNAAIDAALARDPTRRPAHPERLAQLARAGMIGRGATTDTAPTRATAPLRARAAPATTRDTERSAPVYGRFVGRATELARLHDALARTLAGHPPLVLVTGDAGLGKSRLVERFAADARERGALVLTGRCFDYVGSRPPPLETFLTMLSATGADGEAAAARTRAALDDEPGGGARWSAFAAVADALVGQAAGRPLVVILDDLHWATRLDLELVDHLDRSLGPRATLVVATARPAAGGDMTAWRTRRAASLVELALAPFDEDELRTWLEAAFRGIRIGPIDSRRLLRTTGGNPHAVVEIARHLVARGDLVRDPAGWRLRSLGSVDLPDSVAAMVRVRLGELDPDHRAVLETAAVIGDEFRVAALVAASGAGERAVDDALDAGEALRLISERGVSAGNDLRFVSALTRQVLYDELPARARRRIHRAVAAALTELHGDDARFAHVFAYHHHAVGDWSRAVAFGVRAAAEALGRGDLDLAQAAIARADEARAHQAADGAAAEPELDARLDRIAGAVATGLGDLDGGAARLERAIAAAGDVRAVIDARIDLAGNLLARGRAFEAVAAAERAAADAAAAGERVRALTARLVAADASLRTGKLEARTLDELVTETSDLQPGLRARALMVRAWQRMKAGDFAGAEADAITAADLARAAGAPEIQLRALATRAAALGEAGDRAASISTSEQVLDMARRLGDRRREGISLANLGEALVESGDAAAGHERLTAALQVFVDIGDRACEGDCRVNVGRSLLALGQVDEALAMLTAAAEVCAVTGRAEYQGIAHLCMGELHEQRGDRSAAHTDFARAVELFAHIDLHMRWRAELGLARVLVARDELALAHVHATRARDQLASQRARLAHGTDPSVIDAALAEAEALVAATD